jgi:pimeloyl-ACP methyl ester carboxylesterase
VEHTRIAVAGVTLHVVTAGAADAPLVILLHGFPETWQAWQRYVKPFLAIGWRVAIPDQRGYGSSDKPNSVASYVLDVLADDVCGLATALDADKFALVGHDWGGIVAWHVAARHPQRVDRLAILNAPHPASMLGYALTHPFQLARSAYVGFFHLPLVPEALLSADGFALLRASLKRTSKPDTFDPSLLKAYQQAWSEPRAITSMLNWYRAMAMARPLSTPVEAPTLVLWGNLDSALEPGLADEALKYCTRGIVARVEDGTHWLHHEQPVRIGAQLCDFLSQPIDKNSARP